MPLTERQYLGEGYIHVFINDKTGEVVNVPCTQQEYEALALLNPVNPTLKGHTWQYSAGGTVKVDTPDTTLGVNEYCIVGEKVVINEQGKETDFFPLATLTAKLALEER